MSGQPLQGHCSVDVDDGDSDAFTGKQEQQRQQHKQNEPYQVAGTLFPSPEPQPAPIDRWARGWVVSRSTTPCDWVGPATGKTMPLPHLVLVL